MKVSAQYAESHLDELLDATAGGEVVEISRPDQLTVKLTLVSSPTTFDRTGAFGAGKGKIWMADDWDSPKTNEEIAHLFNDGPVFPDEA
jgi:antitoxin (DNA-binding transcriptional repressor) of toxin-antitoxin stability system